VNMIFGEGCWICEDVLCECFGEVCGIVKIMCFLICEGVLVEL